MTASQRKGSRPEETAARLENTIPADAPASAEAFAPPDAVLSVTPRADTSAPLPEKTVPSGVPHPADALLSVAPRADIPAEESLARAAGALTGAGLSPEETAARLFLPPEEVLRLLRLPAAGAAYRARLSAVTLAGYARAVHRLIALMDDENAAAAQKAVHEVIARFEPAADADAETVVRLIRDFAEEDGDG